MSEVSKPEGKRARFRKIEVRMWGDEKFCHLSPIPPCGQGLWIYLLTGPHTGPIPGLFRIGRAAMAEELNWDLEAFDEAFREAFRQGMVKADWKAKVVWIPNAISCNRPESPNVVTSWGAEWELIPECDLKREAYDSLKANICGLGEAFAKAFDKAFLKPSDKPSGKGMPKAIGNQEQEQEQEKDKSPHTPLEGGNGSESGDLLGDDGAKQKRERKPTIALQTFLADCKAKGEKPIPPADPVFAYIARVGIPREFLQLHWLVFKARYTSSGAKRYKDWRAAFRKSIEGCWFKLWFMRADGTCELTTQGLQAQREHGREAA